MKSPLLADARQLLTIGGALTGAVGGLGFVVLLQQFAVAYPTALLGVIGIVGGVLVHIVVVMAVRSLMAGKSRAVVPAPEADVAQGITGAWRASHFVPAGGLDAWAEPDAATPPASALAAGLGVLVHQRHGDWAAIECENGWTAWVDGRRLEDAP